MASSEPLMALPDDPERDERDKRVMMARLDAMAELEAGLLAGLERVIAMLDAFSERAEPLLVMAEKRAKRGALFSGGK